MIQALVLALGLLTQPVASGPEKVLVYCSEASPSTFNPQLGTDGPTFNASSRMIYNRLLEFKPGTTEVSPSLAESWKVSEGGKVYEFRLREGVQFHATKSFTPTRPLAPEDIVFTFERMMKRDHAFHNVGGGTYEYFKAMGLDELIASVRKKDARTVEFRLTRPETPFLANLAMDFASIHSAEYAEHLAKNQLKDRIDTEPVGTGPFALVSYQRDSLIRYRAHDGYYAGRPKLDRVVFAITPEPSVRTQKLKAGECQLVTEVSPQDLPALKSSKDLTVLSALGLNIGYLAMNVEKPPLDKAEVRKAIYHALNRAAYVRAIYLGDAVESMNPIPPTMWSYHTKVQDYEYNPDKAQALFKKAGVGESLELELWTLPVSRAYNPSGKKMGEMMQADLAKVGIRVKLVSYDWSTYLAKARKGEHQLIQMGWIGDNGDPDNFLNTLLGCSGVKAGSNLARWCQADFEQRVARARTIGKRAERERLYREAQEIFKKEVPWVPLAQAVVHRAMSRKVTGYVLSPLGTETFERVDLQ